MNSLYTQTKRNPPKLNIKSDCKEVVLELVSVMCDNKYRFHFKKENDEFKLSTMGQAFGNFNIQGVKSIDLEWLADGNDWEGIVSKINTGTVKVYDAKAR